MKGILVKDNNKWWVRYTKHSPLWPVTPNKMKLPLHPEQQRNAALTLNQSDNMEVEFEIVEYNKPGSSYVLSPNNTYAKLVMPPEEDIEKLAEEARTELNEHVYCCSGEVEEHAFDMGFVSGYYKGKGSLDLKKMEEKLDNQLSKETPESLNEWMKSKRDGDIEELAKKEYPDGVDGTNRSSEVYRRIFIDAYNKAKGYYEVVADVRELHNYKLGLNDGFKKAKENDDTELADIRNKLGALKNLIQMIERGHIVPGDKLKELVEKSIPVCKESIDYLASGKFKINNEQKTT